MQGKSLAWIQFNSVAGLYMCNVVAYLEFHNIFFRSLMLAKMKLYSAARLDIHINSPQKIEFFFCNAHELTILSLSATMIKSEWIVIIIIVIYTFRGIDRIKT